MCVEAMLAYLVSLLASAFSAADPAFRDEAWRWEGASVSGEVTSHATHRPRDHGIIETPSGRFPSDLCINKKKEKNKVGADKDGGAQVFSFCKKIYVGN